MMEQNMGFREQKPLRTIRHDENFFQDAIKALEEGEIDSEPGFIKGYMYRLRPEQVPYSDFLNFVIDELSFLPLDDQMGRSILMRTDAKKILTQLIMYFVRQMKSLQSHKSWDRSAIVPDIFEDENHSDDNEIFKNELYLSYNKRGICYSVDAVNQNRKLTQIVIERFFVDATGKELSVRRDGKFVLNVVTGLLTLEFDDSSDLRIHEGKIVKKLV